MKIRKNVVVALIGMILCAALVGVLLYTKSLLVVIPAVFCGIFLWGLINSALKKRKEKAAVKTEKKPKNINWPLLICRILVVLAAIATILVGIFFGWWFLLPVAILFGLLIWMSLLLGWHEVWFYLFIIATVIAIILLGVFGIASTVRGNTGNVVDGDLVVNGDVILPTGDVNVDKGNVNVNEGDVNVDKGDVNVNEGDVNVDKGNVNVNEGDVNVDKGDVNVNEGDVNVDKGDVNVNEGDVNVGGNVNVTEPPATEPPATTPPTTEPPATEPPATEPPHSHKYTSVETKPTCTEKGYTTYTCSCGHSYKDAYKDALGHSYKTTVVEPTTAAGGYTEYKCERCGHTYKDNFTDKLPEVVPAIKCANTIRYGETVYVNLENISASNLKVSNKLFVSVEVLSDNRVAITLTEDVTGYLTITDSVSRVNVVIDIVEG